MPPENNPADGGGEQDTTNLETQTELEVLNDGDDEVEELEEAPTETEVEEPTEPEGDDKDEDDNEPEESDTPPEEEEEPGKEDEFEETEDEGKISKPGWQALKEKHPSLAKDKHFKYFYHKASELIDLFPTVEDAKQSTQKAESFDVLNGNLVNGDITPILKDINKEVLDKFADKILPALGEVSVDAFKRATRPLVIDILNNVYEYGNETNNDIIKKSVRNVCKVLTGSSDIPARVTPVSQTPEVKAEVDRLREQQRAGYLRDESKFLRSVDFVVSKRIQADIEKDLDPKKELSPYLRSVVAERTFKDVMKKLSEDEGLETSLKRIKGLAARAAFADMYKSRMISAALDRAKKIIPVLRNKHKTAAIGKQPTSGNGRVVADDTRTTEAMAGTTSGKGVTSVRQIDTSKTSELDFLNGKVTLRK